jgi:RHS repeat-associated protein
MTEGFEARNLNIPTGQGQSIAANYVLQTAAGASGVKTATAASDADDGNAHILALRPASAEPKLYFVHVDHLNTPRAIYDANQQLRWKWEQQEPFGVNPPDENPSSLGAYEFNLRFPGQYFDKETNLHYNYFRDYDPVLGRYEQSDPIGLRGGLNTFAYVFSSPLVFVDPHGLSVWDWFKRKSGEEAINEITQTPGKLEGIKCAGKLNCDFWRRFAYGAVYEECKHLYRTEPQGKWARECEDTCSDLMRKKCASTKSCIPSIDSNA